MDRRGGQSRLLQVNSSSSTKRGKLFECVGEPLRDNDGGRKRFTHVWPEIRVYLPQQPESSNPSSIAESACKHCFGKELTELADGSEYDFNACGFCRLPADSYATRLGVPEATPVMHADISVPTSRFVSNFGENTTVTTSSTNFV